jgi:hypothetical protein
VYVNTSGSSAVRASSDNGAGVYAYSESSNAVYAVSSSRDKAVIYTKATAADGTALWAENESTDPTLLLWNDGTGDLIKGYGSDGVVFRVENDGHTKVSVLSITGGSDLSERFDVTAAEGEIAPGMAVCIDANHPGNLLVCTQAHDRTVAGVVSGAGGIAPGMVMGQRGSRADGAYPVALTGRVYVWADASAGPIQPGDLLTTSHLPGHVMRVSDYARAQGAIIGKAMSALDRGQGLVLVLVSLQ